LYENELRPAVAGGQFGDDVGTSRASFGDIGEDLLVEKLDIPKVETSLDVGEE